MAGEGVGNYDEDEVLCAPLIIELLNMLLIVGSSSPLLLS
jgi:hypothetical protein